MTQLKINLRAKQCDNYVENIKQTKTIYLNKEDNKPMLFLQQKLEEEVEKLSKQKQKRFKKAIKVIQTAQITCVSTLGLINPVYATSPIEGLPTPESVMELMTWAIGVSTAIGVGVGIVWMLITRMYYFHPNKKMTTKAVELGINSIKGITEILLVPTLVGIVIVTAYLLLGNSPFFHLPM